ncbi:hypothetical protein PIB30_061394 [Stylosanthes scabra]|uniref:MEKHLA domain-containing protein n=1 Tax=Stylosanthes scabra TaxID=79078 RepID=A0ABU6RKS4_9FABA|nr:hypothetical protein [Stylosanthes scabra]
MIFGLQSSAGAPVTGGTLSNFNALKVECMHNFGITPTNNDVRGSFIKLTWLRMVKKGMQLTVGDFHSTVTSSCKFSNAAHTIEHEEFRFSPEDVALAYDMYLLQQLCSGVDENAIGACAQLASLVFIFANQAGLDMLETTLVALQDIMLDKVLCSEFSKVMQQARVL